MNVPWRLLTTAALFALTATTAIADDRAALMAKHRGGTLNLLASGFDASIDPQIAYDELIWQFHAAVYDGLLTFQKADAEGSNVIVPDLAEAMPEIQDGGATYVFKLRRGVKFSDGQAVTPADVVASFERIFKVSSPTSGYFYSQIIGADVCLKKPVTCSLKDGVIADPDAYTITIKLVKPDAEFLSKVAMPHASILPASIPPVDQGATPVVGTGAYMITEYDPALGIKLVRNPKFKEWSVAAQPDGYVDEIKYTFGLDANAELNAVMNNQADWMFERPPTERLGEISTVYSDRAYIHNVMSFWHVDLNTKIAPFDNKKARQAIAFAIDRSALIDQYGGSNLASPTCQILPAGVPGHEDYCPYTLNPGTTWTAPDLETAKRLIEESGTKGAKVTVFGDDRPNVKANATYLQSLLKDLGYDAELKILSESLYWHYINNTDNNVQIAVIRWMADYPEPANFINMLYGCASHIPSSSSNVNISGFCDPWVEGKMKEANTLALTDKAASNKIWTEIDRYITDEAPGIGMYQPKNVDVFSSRVGGAPIMFPSLTSVTLASIWVQ